MGENMNDQPCESQGCPFCNADNCRADWELFLECQRIFGGATVTVESLEVMPAWRDKDER